MEVDRLIRRFPRLYHMASFDSWPSIDRHGLLSTSALLDLFEVRGTERAAIESQWRPHSITIEHPVHGRALVRDQIPLRRPEHLAERLTGGLTPNDWYRLLNKHVFFWVDEAHLAGLLGARAYRDSPQTVLTVDTRRLVERHRERVRLSSINSGSLLRGGALRGPETLRALADYDRPYVIELCVLNGVPDIDQLALSVEHRWPDGRRVRLLPERS